LLCYGAELGIEVLVTGAEFKPPILSLMGHKAADFFKGINAQKSFLAIIGRRFKFWQIDFRERKKR
jgi:hypothetical protein